MPMRLCDVKECGKVHYAHGYCQMHNLRLSKYGDVNIVRSKKGYKYPYKRIGTKCSEETKKKISIANSKKQKNPYKRSAEQIEKLRNLRKGAKRLHLL